jgi:hypothetical protein
VVIIVVGLGVLLALSKAAHSCGIMSGYLRLIIKESPRLSMWSNF